MAYKFWVVVVENYKHLINGPDSRYQYTEGDVHTMFHLYTRQDRAESKAAELAERNPGTEIHVLTQSHTYVAPPKDVMKKVWKEGNLVPAE